MKTKQHRIENEQKGIMGHMQITRRGFLKVAGTATLVALGGGQLLSIPEVQAGKPIPTTRYPLYIPPTVSPNSLTLTETPTTEYIGGRTSSVWSYNSSFPGPTIIASNGDTATINLVNGLSQETITHWHGMIVDGLNDGHPKYAIPSGGTKSYNFTINQRAALNWYHPHTHMLTNEQVAMGLAGAFIIRDNVENGLGLPSGNYEVPLVVRDASFDAAGNMTYRSGGGDIPMVNGTLSPYLNVDTARYRFRVLSGAQNRIFGLALGNGASFTLIGNDGGLLETSVPITRMDLAPAERADIIIDFGGYPVGTNIMLKDLRTGWDLLEFKVTRSVTDTGTTPTALSTITKLSNPVNTRTFNFEGMSKINGKVYDLNRIDFQVPFGVTELWRFTTKGAAPHPVHIHGASFQIQSRTGGRGQLFPWESGWKDTVLLEDSETVEILISFDKFRSEGGDGKGLYLIHCHRLEHEDKGMMSNFEVV
ncbi:MAG: multicopper oxidase domain-containing protein [Candidatus Methanoperedens sp.]|nr:multicopper oxidase domain-containing protein [Candidatus Methanoperedens sp.]